MLMLKIIILVKKEVIMSEIINENHAKNMLSRKNNLNSKKVKLIAVSLILLTVLIVIIVIKYDTILAIKGDLSNSPSFLVTKEISFAQAGVIFSVEITPKWSAPLGISLLSTGKIENNLYNKLSLKINTINSAGEVSYFFSESINTQKISGNGRIGFPDINTVWHIKSLPILERNNKYQIEVFNEVKQPSFGTNRYYISVESIKY